MAIPKTIHYIWLGKSKKPKNFTETYQSWVKYAPGFSITEWNEDSISEFDLPEYYYRSYNSKKWAFASDVLRFHILEKYGGVYLDIDQVLLRSIDTDELLNNQAFLGKYHELDTYFGFGIIGSVKNSEFSKRINSFYRGYVGSKDIIVNKIGSQIAIEIHQNSSDMVTVFPQEYFYPLTEKDITAKTYTKHLANTSWVPKWKKVLQAVPGYVYIKKAFFLVLPASLSEKIKKVDY